MKYSKYAFERSGVCNNMVSHHIIIENSLIHVRLHTIQIQTKFNFIIENSLIQCETSHYPDL